MAVTSQQFIVISDVCHHCILVLYPSGGVRNCFGKFGDDINSFDHPYYLAVTGDDDIVISDSGNTRIKITNINGATLRVFEANDFRLYDEHFVLLYGVTVDTDDNILIIGNNTIYLVASNGRLWEVILPSHGLTAPRALCYSRLGHLVVTQFDLDQKHEVSVFSFNKEDFQSLRRIPFQSIGNRMTQSDYTPLTSNQTCGYNFSMSQSCYQPGWIQDSGTNPPMTQNLAHKQKTPRDLYASPNVNLPKKNRHSFPPRTKNAKKEKRSCSHDMDIVNQQSPEDIC